MCGNHQQPPVSKKRENINNNKKKTHRQERNNNTKQFIKMKRVPVYRRKKDSEYASSSNADDPAVKVAVMTYNRYEY